jgi:DNA-binding HxlR family transcriptional regulator
MVRRVRPVARWTTSDVKSFLLAERYPDLLCLLARVGFALPRQLAALAAADGARSAATYERRLREMRRAGLVDRVVLRREGTRLVVYHLTWDGALAAARLMHDADVLRYHRRLAVETVHLEHHLGVLDLVCELARVVPGVEIVPKWRARLRWRFGGAYHSVTPDLVLLVPARKPLVVEYDRGTRYVPDLTRQVQRYAEAEGVAELPSWAREGLIVYVFEHADVARRDAVLKTAADAGIGGRVVVVPLDDLHDLVEVVIEGGGKSTS